MRNLASMLGDLAAANQVAVLAAAAASSARRSTAAALPAEDVGLALKYLYFVLLSLDHLPTDAWYSVAQAAVGAIYKLHPRPYKYVRAPRPRKGQPAEHGPPWSPYAVLFLSIPSDRQASCLQFVPTCSCSSQGHGAPVAAHGGGPDTIGRRVGGVGGAAQPCAAPGGLHSHAAAGKYRSVWCSCGIPVT